MAYFQVNLTTKIMKPFGAFQNRLFLFSCACLSGILFALVWRKYELTVQISTIRNRYASSMHQSNYNDWLKEQNLRHKAISNEVLSYNSESLKTFQIESNYLYTNTPVLCLIFTRAIRDAEAVKQTWAKHCNFVTFFGKFTDEKIPVMKVTRFQSFEGFCYAFTHIYHKYKSLFKWILIADDNTYAIVENLRHYVAPLNSSLPYYLGHPIRDFANIYNTAKAGIVLSKGSLDLLNSVYSSADDCLSKRSPSWYFDQSLGRILSSFNVQAIDTRDSYLRTRFNPFSIEKMLIPGSISVFNSYWRSSVFLSEEGMNCCSDRAITFSGIFPSKMFLMEYLQYHLSAFREGHLGLGNRPPDPHPSHNPEPYKLIPVGEPYIQLLDRNWVKQRRHPQSKQQQKSFVKNVLDDLFGSPS